MVAIRNMLLVLLLAGMSAAQVQNHRKVTVAGGNTPDTVCTGGTLKRWYRADTAVCGGGACANGNGIDVFTDKAGNGDATWTGGASKATFTTATLNGQTVGVQTGAGYYVIGGAGYTPTALTGYAVVKFSSIAGNNTIFGPGPTTNNGALWRSASTTGVQDLVDPAVALIGSSSTGLGTAAWHKIAFTYDSVTGNYAFYKDGTATDGTGTNAHTFTQPIGFFLAFDTFSTDPFLGSIAEMFVCDGVNSGAQINNIMGGAGYFFTRYGL
jgi:hypothetical protein